MTVQLGTFEVSEADLKLIETMTGEKGAWALNTFTVAMATEFVWPDQNSLEQYLSCLRSKREE